MSDHKSFVLVWNRFEPPISNNVVRIIVYNAAANVMRTAVVFDCESL